MRVKKSNHKRLKVVVSQKSKKRSKMTNSLVVVLNQVILKRKTLTLKLVEVKVKRMMKRGYRK